MARQVNLTEMVDQIADQVGLAVDDDLKDYKIREEEEDEPDEQG